MGLRMGLFLSVLFFTSPQFADSLKTLPIHASHNSLEEQIIQVLTGKNEFKGQKITERGSLKNRKLTREYLSEKLIEFGYEPQTQQYSSNGANVYAILPATSLSDEYIVVGAHFDSVGNEGANDNASGTAIVMAMAKNLRSITNRSKNIIFCLFDEEEHGLIGSQKFAQKLLNEKLNIHSVHTIDQLAFDADGDKAIEIEAAPQELYDFYQNVNLSTGFNIPLKKSPVTSTDHNSFRALGFKALGVTEEYYHGDTTPCYHEECDTYDGINFEYLLNGSQFWQKVISEFLKETPK